MVCGRRESLRKHAIDIACCSNPPERTDWDLFYRTGEFRKKPQMDYSPELAAKLKEITENNGVLIVDCGVK